MKCLPELLAPAGNKEALAAVIEAGADAVYVAGKLFGMRQHAHWLNFEDADLQAAIGYAHQHGRRIYVTVNNLLTDVELEQAEPFLDKMSEWKPDAIIIQDLGLLHRLQDRAWPFELHASCMMNVHSLPTARVLGRLGVSRIIASRDITLEAAAALGQQSGIEFECFLHGDMCIAQSGQCTTSGIMAGESASRGRCLKPCRWQWKLVSRSGNATDGGGGFLLARNDLCLFEHIPAIVESGISAVKIEGRARRPEHLARIVRAYRTAYDAYAADPAGYRLDQRLFADLHEHRIRDFSTCMTFGDQGHNGIGRQGSREPRIFSVVIEQPSLNGRSEVVESPNGCQPRPELVVHCGDVAGVEAALGAGAGGICIGGELWRQYVHCIQMQDVQRIKRLCADSDVRLYWEAPRISESASITEIAVDSRQQIKSPLPGEPACHKPVLSPEGAFDSGLDALFDCFDGCYVHSLGQCETARQLDLPIIADHGCNLFNVAAMGFAADLGATRAVPSLELGLAQIESISASTPVPLEFVVHGPVVGMISEHCIVKAAGHCDAENKTGDNPPCANAMALQDSAGQLYPLMTDAHCRNHILLPRRLSALPVLGRLLALRPSHVRIDGRHDTPDVLRLVVTIYAAALDRLCRGLPVAEDAMAQLVTAQPGGLTIGAYGLAVAEVSLPGEGLPTNEWVQPDEVGSATQYATEAHSIHN